MSGSSDRVIPIHTFQSAPQRGIHSLLGPLINDARHVQLLLLGSFLAYSMVVLNFAIAPGWVLLTLLMAAAMQWVWSVVVARIPYDPRSALISGFSTLLLLRVDEPLWWLVAVTLAVSCAHPAKATGLIRPMWPLPW